ncbi:MAG: iron-containing alcohol dehydrogenase [Clostridia bacterium]|nr:iron-containing alcohol dehydrogenase [Clostridia bacterium]
MNITSLLNRDIACACGHTHRCDIAHLAIAPGALANLPALVAGYSRILLVADDNTYDIAGERVTALLGGKLAATVLPEAHGHLVPDEAAIAAIEAKADGVDFILGIGSGVINDLCKFVSFHRGIECGIVATAPSMDGYASSGAAMILGGMKVTETTHAPALILGDTDILAAAPMDMIRAGYADIIGKFSALCDWKLSAFVNGEYLCPWIYDIVMEKTKEIRALAKAIAARDADAIRALMEALVLIGACLTLTGSTRPGSGSEHHLSHYFEITGLLRGEPYFCHGIDVGHATVLTAAMREALVKSAAPEFTDRPASEREAAWARIYGRIAPEVAALQEKAGRYAAPKLDFYRAHWDEIREILAECPTADEIFAMLTDVGFTREEFRAMYSAAKVADGRLYAKDLKDRYSVLWIYYYFMEEAK